MTEQEVIKAMKICAGLDKGGCRVCPLSKIGSAVCVSVLMGKACDILGKIIDEDAKFGE